jgi:hypothetical protein
VDVLLEVAFKGGEKKEQKLGWVLVKVHFKKYFLIAF